MKSTSVFSVTLTPELFERLSTEAKTIGVALEWLVAALVADTLDSESLRLPAV